MNDRRQQLEAQLSAYLDGELTAQERAEIEAWLAQDAEARALLADLESISSGLRSLPRTRVSVDMVQAIQTRLERQALLGKPEDSQAGRSRGRSLGFRWAAAAAIVLMTSTAGYVTWWLNTQESGQPAAPQLALVEQAAKPSEQPMSPLADASSVGRERYGEYMARSKASPSRGLARHDASHDASSPPAVTSLQAPASGQYYAKATEEARHASKGAAGMEVGTDAYNYPAAKSAWSMPAGGRGKAGPGDAGGHGVTVLEVACADRNSQQQLVDRLSSEARGAATFRSAARSQQQEVEWGVAARPVGADGTQVVEVDVVVPDEQARRQMIARAEGLSERARVAGLPLADASVKRGESKTGESKTEESKTETVEEAAQEDKDEAASVPVPASDAEEFGLRANEAVSVTQPAEEALTFAPATSSVEQAAGGDYRVRLTIRVAPRATAQVAAPASRPSEVAGSVSAGEQIVTTRPPMMAESDDTGVSSRPASQSAPSE
jgi:hypothetical protein